MKLHKTALAVLMACSAIVLGGCGDNARSTPDAHNANSTKVNSDKVAALKPAVLEIQLLLRDSERKVSGVEIEVQWDDSGIPSNTSTWSNKDGLVHVEFEHGSQLLSVHANPGNYSAPGSIEAPAVLFGGLTHSIEMVLQPAGAVYGTVYDIEGLPVAGAKVFCYFNSPEFVDKQEELKVDVFTTSDDQGRFALGGIPAGPFVLEAAFEKQMSVWRPGGVMDEAASYKKLEIFLEPAHSVYGQVIDQNEEPVAGVKITAGKPNRRKNRRDTDYENVFNYGTRSSVTRSGDDGTFMLSAVPDSQGWNVNARHPDFVQTYVVIDAGQIDVWVELKETISLTGVVSGGDGTVLNNAQLWLLTDERDVSVGSDVEGSYKFSGLHGVDDVYLIAHHPQHGTALIGPVMFAGQSQVLDVRLIAGQSISGTVVDADGAPLANVGVQIKGTLPRDNFSESRLPERFLGMDSSLTNSDGFFVFENLHASSFEIVVYPAGKPAVFKRDVKVGDTLEIKVME
jgi:protocatechuate 3,4-dioxygenase beta subunit